MRAFLMAPDAKGSLKLDDATGEPPKDGGSSTSLSWQQVVALVGAAAGGAAWVSAVGSAIVGLRLGNADLPVEAVVALMSPEHRFAIGAGYLIAPLFVGLVGFVVDWLLIKRLPDTPPSAEDTPPSAEDTPPSAEDTPAHEEWRNPKRWWDVLQQRRTKVAVIAVFSGFAAGLLLLSPPVPLLFALQFFALLIIVVVVIGIYADRPKDHHRVDERIIVFVSVLVSAGAIALAYEQLRPDADFDAAHIRLKEGATVDGGYITTTDTAVVLITRGSHDCPAITAVRRDQVEQIWIGPTKLQVSVDDSQLCTRTQEWHDFPIDDR
jgi:hypothetical protein